MDKVESEKLYKALGNIRDMIVETTYKEAINVADRASRNSSISERKRHQWREYRDEITVNRDELIASEADDKIDNFEEDREKELYGTYSNLEVSNSRLKEVDSLATQKASEVVYKQSGQFRNYQWYLERLKKDFKKYRQGVCSNVDLEIEEFIRMRGLQVIGVTVADVKTDLYNNDIMYIFEAHERYLDSLKAYFENGKWESLTDKSIEVFICKKHVRASKFDIIQDLRKYSIAHQEYVEYLKQYFENNKCCMWSDRNISAVIYKNKLDRKLGITESEIKQDIYKYSIIPFNENKT